MKKPKTKQQLDRATDQRLRKTYNISLVEYNLLLKKGGGGCWISGQPAGTRRLHVDHDHGWKKVKIESFQESPPYSLGKKWMAEAEYNDVRFVGWGDKKSEAVRSVKRQLLRASVRGLLTYSLNAGLQKFSDDPLLLRNAAMYLERHRDQSPLTGQEPT